MAQTAPATTTCRELAARTLYTLLERRSEVSARTRADDEPLQRFVVAAFAMVRSGPRRARRIEELEHRPKRIRATFGTASSVLRL